MMQRIAALVLFSSVAIHQTDAAEIKVLSTNAMRPVVSALAAEFERATSHKVVTTYTQSPQEVSTKIADGEVFDVAISASAVIDSMAKANQVLPESRTDIARTGIGLATRAGAGNPDIASPDTFKRVMLGAKSVAYASEGRSGPHFLDVLARYGISDEMKSRLKPMTTPTSVAAVAAGDVELGVLPVPGILAGKGVQLAGMLPKDAQLYLEFSAAVIGKSAQAKDAAEFVTYLASPSADRLVAEKGLERNPR